MSQINNNKKFIEDDFYLLDNFNNINNQPKLNKIQNKDKEVKEKNKKIMKFVSVIIPIIAVIILYFSYIILNTTLNNYFSSLNKNSVEINANEQIIDEVVYDLINEHTIIEETYSKNILDARSQYKNNDIIGELIINNTSINNLLTHTFNNTYYLDKDLSKNLSKNGSLILDYRNNPESVNDVTIIYGNSNFDDDSFNELHSYTDQQFYDNNKYINLNLGLNNYTYEIFSVISDNNNLYEHNVILKNTDKQNLIVNTIENSVIVSDTQVSEDDKILILKTIETSKSQNTIYIVGKLKI